MVVPPRGLKEELWKHVADPLSFLRVPFDLSQSYLVVGSMGVVAIFEYVVNGVVEKAVTLLVLRLDES